jgi:tetratricopeptide (TPR) repeat protein
LSSGSEPVSLELASTARPARAAQRREARARSSVETLRLKAGLARIAAERLDAPIHAPGVFREGRSFEQQGEKLLRRGRYAAALDAYERALDLYTRAETLSREERVRTIQIAGTASGP